MSAEERTPFISEWRMLFGEAADSAKIRKYCFRGRLQDSRLRAIVWRILLRVLPVDRVEWTALLDRDRRKYNQLRHQMELDPRNIPILQEEEDIENPLSLHQNSLWHQYFTDRALRKVVDKDVDRTFPDLHFFQTDRIKRIMSNVLFFHSKCNSEISYRQGMHELLAPILFVLDVDQRAYRHLRDQNVLRPKNGISEADIHILDALNDPTFLEHDTFAMFTQLMMLLSRFYLKNDSPNENGHQNSFKAHIDRVPFSSKSCQSRETSELLRKLAYIHEELLLEIDPPLYNHLNSLQILPQLYGVRWLRLLFGREFPLLDLLYLWDVIFLDQPDLCIVDYIFVAFLVQIRNLLLQSDSCTCIQYLMQYPPISDVHAFIQFVYNLKASRKISNSTKIAHNFYAQISLAGNNALPKQQIPSKGPIVSRQRTESDRLIELKRKQSIAKANPPMDNVINKIGKQALSAVHPFQFNNAARRDANKQVGCKQVYMARSVEHLPAVGAANSNSMTIDVSHELELMKEQIAQLQSRLNDSDLLKQLCARRILTLTKEMMDGQQKSVDDTNEDLDLEEWKRKIAEISEIAEQLTRSSVSEQLILRHLHHPPPSSSNQKGEAVEVASEALGFQLSTPSNLISHSSSLSPLHGSNEMVELRFENRKKNF